MAKIARTERMAENAKVVIIVKNATFFIFAKIA